MKPHLTFENGWWFARHNNHDGKTLGCAMGKTPAQAFDSWSRLYNTFWRKL